MATQQRKSKSSNRGWWRDHFHDCLPSDTDPRFHLYGSGTKGKAYCKECWKVDWDALNQAESGRDGGPRNSEVLNREMWMNVKGGLLSNHADTLCNHLISCVYVSQSIKDRATTRKTAKGSTPETTRFASAHAYGINPPLPAPMFTNTGISLNDPPLAGPSSHRYQPYLTSIANSQGSDLGDHGSSISRSPSTSSLSPSDSISVIGADNGAINSPGLGPVSLASHSLSSRRKSKRHLPSNFVVQTSTPWGRERKKRWETLIAELTASAGFPLAWVDNPVWRTIREEFFPEAPVISRKALTTRILRDTANEIQENIRKRVEGKDVTLQADGWTGINNHHLVAFMVTCEKEVHTVKVHDTSGDRKTADNLVIELESVFKLLTNSWKAVVIAVVTDASGESRKARRIFGERYPWIIVLDCYSHQINLVVGDFTKSNSDLIKVTDKATELITWLRSKSLILHHLPQSVLRAVLTRWTSHYTAFSRLLFLKNNLVMLADADLNQPVELSRVMITGSSASQRKAKEMVQTIKDPLFWHQLSLIKRYLEPLAVAANITQSAFCRLDQVLLTFGFLIMMYSLEPSLSTEDPIARDAIIESLERRWFKSDQELFIASVIVNPIHRAEPFSNLPFLNIAQIQAMLIRIWKRLYQSTSEPPVEFNIHIKDFLLGRGFYQTIKDVVERETARAFQAKEQPDPVQILESFCFPNHPPPVFIAFALRLLSVSANSASCERLFSAFGNILTKLRSRLKNQTLVYLSTVKMNVRDRYIKPDEKARTKRHFGLQPAQDTDTIPTRPPTPVHSGRPQIFPGPPPLTFISHPTPSTSVSHPVDSSEPLGPLTDPSVNSAFRDILHQHALAAEDDASDPNPVRTSAFIQQTTLSSLFNFASTGWVERYHEFLKFSWEDEMEFYGLLDMDGMGEEDLDLDDSMQEILGTR